MGKIDPNKILITSIKTLKGNINSTDEESEMIVKQYQIECTSESTVNIDEKLIRIIFKIDIFVIDESDEKTGTYASYTNEFIFLVDNLDKLTKLLDNGVVEIDVELSKTLLSISFSTSRGMIYNRTQGTILNGIILPVVNPNDLLNSSKKTKK